jgi:hypothetical protein
MLQYGCMILPDPAPSCSTVASTQAHHEEPPPRSAENTGNSVSDSACTKRSKCVPGSTAWVWSPPHLTALPAAKVTHSACSSTHQIAHLLSLKILIRIRMLHVPLQREQAHNVSTGYCYAFCLPSHQRRPCNTCHGALFFLHSGARLQVGANADPVHNSPAFNQPMHTSTLRMFTCVFGQGRTCMAMLV